MRQQGIRRVCCLLESQLTLYESDLLEAYRASFGKEKVCWAPIEDFQLVDEKLLTETILPFLGDSVRCEEKVVVHCSAGSGRTGHVLAAWMVYGRGMTNAGAIDAVKKMGRNPHEATRGDPAKEAKLKSLFDASRAAAGGISR
jgi:protein-tyrosine phosphatase